MSEIGRASSFEARHFLLRVGWKWPGPPRDEYPFDIPAVRAVADIEFHPKVTFLVGENGSGKSTITEALAVLMGLNPEGGTENFAFATRASHSTLVEALRPVRGFRRPRNRFFLRAESFFNVATAVENYGVEDSYGGRSLHEQSHGESFMALMLERFGPDGLYILDEPEAALSPQRQLAMLVRLHDLIGLGSQFIVATHSPLLMAYPDAVIYRLDEGGVARVALRDTDHYRITLDTLRDPEKRMADLLRD